jgi:hypothetical protein
MRFQCSSNFDSLSNPKATVFSWFLTFWNNSQFFLQQEFNRNHSCRWPNILLVCWPLQLHSWGCEWPKQRLRLSNFVRSPQLLHCLLKLRLLLCIWCTCMLLLHLSPWLLMWLKEMVFTSLAISEFSCCDLVADLHKSDFLDIFEEGNFFIEVMGYWFKFIFFSISNNVIPQRLHFFTDAVNIHSLIPIYLVYWFHLFQDPWRHIVFTGVLECLKQFYFAHCFLRCLWINKILSEKYLFGINDNLVRWLGRD